MAGLDVSDILGSRPIAERRLTAARGSHKPPAAKKPDGVSREVFALTAGMPCVVPTASSAYKERRSLGNVVPCNPGRSDGAKLFHWAKKHDNDEYYFAQYNKLMKIDTYTDAEYEEHLKGANLAVGIEPGSDPEWTREQTDELLDLAKRLDTRFILVADRATSGKSVEEIKARYYAIGRKLLEIRTDYTDEEVSKMPLSRFQYDKEYDVKRKAQLNLILSRTVREMQEEHMLVKELQAIDSTMKKDQKLRARARKATEALSAPDARATGTRSQMKEVGPACWPGGSGVQSKRMRIGTAGSNKTLIVKVKGSGVNTGERKSTARRSQLDSAPENSTEAQVLRRMQTLGVAAWPLPMANVCAAHAELVGLLMDLEKKLKKKKIK